MLERKYFIKAYEYWWGYTAAQIELMVMDQPVISYKSNKKNDKSLFGTREEADEMDKLADRWKELNGEGQAGKKVDLNEFLRKKM